MSETRNEHINYIGILNYISFFFVIYQFVPSTQMMTYKKIDVFQQLMCNKKFT